MDRTETITLGAGCFWCVEAVFQNLKGIESAVSGYSGGHIKNPAYREVCHGVTGHAEVVQLQFNPAVISVKEILQIFWQTHDPTTLNRQGNDIGTQYRSAVFYHTFEQKQIAEQYKDELNHSKAFSGQVVTEIAPFVHFYPAEQYHQNYFKKHPEEAYCQYIVKPKIKKFEKLFKDKLKS